MVVVATLKLHVAACGNRRQDGQSCPKAKVRNKRGSESLSLLPVIILTFPKCLLFCRSQTSAHLMASCIAWTSTARQLESFQCRSRFITFSRHVD